MTGDDRCEGDRGGPAFFGSFVEGEHEPADGDDREQRSGDVEAGFGVFDGVRDE
jgi:hypothetical protein